MEDRRRYYQILGLELGASAAEVRQAYRSLAKRWHPDLFVGEPKRQEVAAAEFRKIVEAYSILRSEESLAVASSDAAPKQTTVRTQRTEIEDYFTQGVEATEKEDYPAALEAFSIVIRLQPHHREAYRYRSFVCAKLGYENRANSDRRRAAELELAAQVREPSASKSASNSPWQCQQTILSHRGPISAIAINQAGWCAAAAGDRIQLWELGTGAKLGELSEPKQQVSCLAFRADGRLLVSAGEDCRIRLWNVPKRSLLKSFLTPHEEKIAQVALTPDSQTLISGSLDKTIHLWQLAVGKLRRTIKNPAAVEAIAVAPNGQVFACGGLEKYVRLWEVGTAKMVRSFRGNGAVTSLAFSPDGKRLAAGCLDRTVRLWDVATGEAQTLGGHLEGISSVQFSPDGRYLASGSWDQTIKLWRLDGEEVTTLTGHEARVLAIAFGPGSKTLASGSADGILKFWRYIGS
ncbi:MAG: DnaJ domain-containing protein [Chloroflexaceae bacterium]|nr:DnaJ domain-containing protein [Chloroflexaceae bacterium]